MKQVKNIEITTIDSVECLGEVEDTVYDVGMVDNPHTFFANDLLVHNSVFFSALPLIRHRHAEIDESDDAAMTEKILVVAKDVQNFLNKSFDLFGKNFMNIEPGEHLFDIKQEMVARRAFWVTKKRYAQWIINKKGYSVPPGTELDVKGLDIKRSSFPRAFKGIMKKVIVDILNDVPKEEIDEYILAFKGTMKEMSFDEVANPTGVKNITKWKRYDVKEVASHVSADDLRYIKSNNGSLEDLPEKLSSIAVLKNGYMELPPFVRKTGTPAHVKAALNYNDLLELLKLNKRYAPLRDGEKIKWIYMKSNPYGIESLAIKGHEDPKKILDIANQYMDPEKMFDRALQGKLDDFYSALSWSPPNPFQANVDSFFGF